jgi:hypothetical protein
MRAWKLALAVVTSGASGALACSSTGTQAYPVEAGLDATNPGDDASSESGVDGGEDADAEPMCSPLLAPERLPSRDCVFAGSCPQDCSLGAASAYACIPLPPIGDAAPAPAYPAVFTAPIGIVNVVALDPTAYPWDAAAYIACAPLSCVRWSFADHVGGTSAWAGDPCSDGGSATEAWSCPLFAGLAPPVAGCFDTGGLGAIGGSDSGIPAQNVWCCPGPADAGTLLDSATSDDGSTGDAGVSQDASGE